MACLSDAAGYVWSMVNRPVWLECRIHVSIVKEKPVPVSADTRGGLRCQPKEFGWTALCCRDKKIKIVKTLNQQSFILTHATNPSQVSRESAPCPSHSGS